MKIQMIGHASIFVETQDCNILMDPVLWDPHGEGIFDVCPKREVIHDQIPKFDLLIISHQHLDHFDIRSLACLPKTVDVLIPKDKLLDTCLRQLGYSHIYHLSDFSEVKLGNTSILATRSEESVPELGIVFADDSGVCWNQVDTVINLDTIHFVKSRYPQIDFLLANWQPMLEVNYHTNQSLSFPYSEYNRLLESISLIQPKAIAPGANGFKYINGSSWLNQIVFPVTPEQFFKDVKMVYPEIGENIFALEPGDILSFNQGEFSHLEQKCHFVIKLDTNREDLDFSPVNIGNKLIDENPDNYNLDEMKEVIKEEVCLNLPKFFREKKSSLFIEHCRWQVIYQLEIVFPDSCNQWFFDFANENIELQVGRNPLANFFTKMTASSFYSLIKQHRGWDYTLLGGNYRCFNKIYIANKYGINKPQNTSIKDPLTLKFPPKEIFDIVRYREVEKWGQSNDKISISHEKNTYIMNLGKHLVRVLK